MEPRSAEGSWGVRGCLSRLKAERTETRRVARRQSLVGVREPAVPLCWCRPRHAHFRRLFSSSPSIRWHRRPVHRQERFLHGKAPPVSTKAREGGALA